MLFVELINNDVYCIDQSSDISNIDNIGQVIGYYSPYLYILPLLQSLSIGVEKAVILAAGVILLDYSTQEKHLNNQILK